MRSLILLMLTVLICPLAQWMSAAPTPTPAVPNSSPHVAISVSATTVRVGETLTITGVPVNLGLPIYTLMLSSGASASVGYDDQPHGDLVGDAQFEIVSAQGAMNAVTFVLRARATGTAVVQISATGEARTAQGAYLWSSGGSDALTLTVSP